MPLELLTTAIAREHGRRRIGSAERTIALLGASAAAGPLAARAQQDGRVRRIGPLMAQAQHDPQSLARVAAFRQGPERLGWAENRNLQIDYRYALVSAEQMQGAAKEFVALQPELIVAHGVALATVVRSETRAIPMVFIGVSDPIGPGLVARLARPGGNATGTMLYEAGITGKWLALLKEIAPHVARAAIVANPKTTSFDYYTPTP